MHMWKNEARGYAAVLMSTVIFLPCTAGVLTVFLFLTGLPASASTAGVLLVGGGGAGVGWLISGFCSRKFADARYAIPSSYGALGQRLDEVLCQILDCPTCTAKIQALTQVMRIKRELREKSLTWTLGRGYINAWSRLHRAEESIIEVIPQEAVIAGALSDILRLHGSKIEHATELIRRLEEAIRSLDASALMYVEAPLTTDSDKTVAQLQPLVPLGATSDHKLQARSIIREVRYAINKFRDGRWNGLVVARNRLIATMVFTAMMAYLLLVLCIAMGAPPSAIAASTVFYLIGATIGLLNQLHNVAKNDTAVEDYGLSSARLITVPMICGLAAVGGVVLTAMPQITNSFSAPTKTSVQPLIDIFDLHKNIFGLVVAAFFGLTPGLLFNKLQQQSEKYKEDLKGSEVTQIKRP